MPGILIPNGGILLYRLIAPSITAYGGSMTAAHILTRVL